MLPYSSIQEIQTWTWLKHAFSSIHWHPWDYRGSRSKYLVQVFLTRGPDAFPRTHKLLGKLLWLLNWPKSHHLSITKYSCIFIYKNTLCKSFQRGVEKGFKMIILLRSPSFISNSKILKAYFLNQIALFSFIYFGRVGPDTGTHM